MLFALAYVLVAGATALLTHAWVHRSSKPQVGLAYLRASMGMSAALVAIDLLIFMVFGVWWMPVGAAIGIGIIWPGVMTAIT